VLVTGGAGFVGRHLGPRLVAGGCEAIGRDQEVDITDPAALEREVERVAPDAIVHLAAQASVAASSRDETATFHVNYLGARNLLEAAARRAPRARVLIVSSGDVYGASEPSGPPFDELAPLRPRSVYARTKACADLLAGEYAQRGLDVVRVRPFAHTGPGQSDAFVVPSFAQQAVAIAEGRREPRLVVGNLESVRDFLDVEDVVDAYARLLDSAVPAGVYNLASGIGRRIAEVLDGLLACADTSPSIEVDPARYRPAECSVGDAARLRAATGWAPRVPFTRTLERVIGDWRQRTSAS
jgi:GDP-4-dehydro-6-deoxy-D-mannose reductase